MKTIPFSDVVSLNFHQPKEVIFKVPDDEEKEMKDDGGDESPGSAAKRSLKKLLELEDPPEPNHTSAEMDEAKDVLTTRPFDIA